MNTFDAFNQPVVSIVLPTMNGASFIGKTIESILAQTLESFELIIIDDGSTDETANVIRQFNDSRIRMVFQENQGVCRATNLGFSLACGKYLSRHDHDDISVPERFEKQVKFLEEHPECHFVGSWSQIWINQLATNRIHRHPITPGMIAFSLLFNSPFVHSSCLMRKEVFEVTGGYTLDADRVPPEDYEYFSRISREFSMANIAECLVLYHELPNSMSSVLRANENPVKMKFISNLGRISSENLAYACGLSGRNQHTDHFGALVHQNFSALPYKYDYSEIEELIIQAAKKIVIRFNEPKVMTLLKEQLGWMRYQYHTQQGNTYHLARLRYLYLHRPWHENFESLGRLLNKINPLRTH